MHPHTKVFIVNANMAYLHMIGSHKRELPLIISLAGFPNKYLDFLC